MEESTPDAQTVDSNGDPQGIGANKGFTLCDQWGQTVTHNAFCLITPHVCSVEVQTRTTFGSGWRVPFGNMRMNYRAAVLPADGLAGVCLSGVSPEGRRASWKRDDGPSSPQKGEEEEGAAARLCARPRAAGLGQLGSRAPAVLRVCGYAMCHAIVRGVCGARCARGCGAHVMCMEAHLRRSPEGAP